MDSKNPKRHYLELSVSQQIERKHANPPFRVGIYCKKYKYEGFLIDADLESITIDVERKIPNDFKGYVPYVRNKIVTILRQDILLVDFEYVYYTEEIDYIKK